MGNGKAIRLRRLLGGEEGVSIIFAIDHGMTSPTVLGGLKDTPERVREAVAGGANAVMLSRGFLTQCQPSLAPETSVALMLTASAVGLQEEGIIAPIGTVQEALMQGADAVVCFVPLSGPREREVIEFIGDVGAACERLGMPFIAEAEYPTTYASVDDLGARFGVEYLRRNARLCVELGADLVKVNWTGDESSFAEIVGLTGVPVVVAGGSLVSDEELLQRMEQARRAGAVGASIGRNIFEHDNPERITRAVSMIFREGASAEDALSLLERPLAEVATS